MSEHDSAGRTGPSKKNAGTTGPASEDSELVRAPSAAGAGGARRDPLQAERRSVVAQLRRSVKAWADRDADPAQDEAESQTKSEREQEQANDNEQGEESAIARKVFLARKTPEEANQEKWRQDPVIVAKIQELQLPTSGSISFIPRVVKKGGELQLERAAATNAKGNAKGKSGPVDIEGRIWIRNYAHAGYPDHWDVQIDGGADYMNVTLQGELMKKIDPTAPPSGPAPRPGGGFGGNKK